MKKILFTILIILLFAVNAYALNLAGYALMQAASCSTPDAPSNVAATAGDEEVDISWDAVAGADSYNLYYDTSTMANCKAATKVTGVTSPYTKTGLTNDTEYFFRLTTVDGGCESACSDEDSATPAAPSYSCKFGYCETDGSGVGAIQNYVECQPFTGTTATITAVRIWPNVTGPFKAAIYSGASTPSTLLAKNNTGASLSSGAWRTLDLDVSVSTTNGTKYWLCALTATGQVSMLYETGGGYYKAATYSGYEFPSSLSDASDAGVFFNFGAWGY